LRLPLFLLAALVSDPEPRTDDPGPQPSDPPPDPIVAETVNGITIGIDYAAPGGSVVTLTRGEIAPEHGGWSPMRVDPIFTERALSLAEIADLHAWSDSRRRIAAAEAKRERRAAIRIARASR
jgi:hypothetical protein